MDQKLQRELARMADGVGSGTICYGPPGAALDHPMVPLTWLANELSHIGIGLEAGQMISTDALTGMLRPKAA